MKYNLQINFQDNALYYLSTDNPRLRTIISQMDQLRILTDLQYYKPATSKKHTLTSFSDWGKIRNIPEDYLYLCDKNRLENANKVLEVNFLFDKISLKISDQHQDFENFHQVEASFNLLLSLSQENKLGLDLWSGVRVLETHFKRPRPPRNIGKLPSDAVLDVINTKISDPPLQLDRIIEAYQTVLPNYVSIQSFNHYLIINWIANKSVNCKSIESVESVMTDRLIWYYNQCDFSISGMYNEQGDSLKVLHNPIEHLFYTYYISFDNTAYKALVPYSERLVEDDLITSMIFDLKQRKCSDGKILSAVSLILPSRELAIKYHDEALKLGFNCTIYPDNQGNLWNPFPEGNWII